MKKALRFACLAILALAVAGCGKKPQVPKYTVVAAFVDFEKTYENGKSLAKAIIKEFPESARPDATREYENALKFIDDCRESLNPKWAVIAFGGTIKDLLRAPRENIAIAVRIDADENTADNMLKKWVTKMTGRDNIAPDKCERGVIYEAYSSYAGRIDDDFLILANSKDAFMNMFDLYRGKSEPSKDFEKLSGISGNTVMRIATVPIYSLISRFELTEAVEKLGMAGNDEDLADMIFHLGALTLDILAEDDDIALSLRIICGSSDDAKILERLFLSIAFMSRVGFDLGAYFAENPDRIPKALRHHKNKICQSKDFFNAIARAFNAARDGRVAEITFANSIDMIAKFITTIMSLGKPVENESSEPPQR